MKGIFVSILAVLCTTFFWTHVYEHLDKKEDTFIKEFYEAEISLDYSINSIIRISDKLLINPINQYLDFL